MTDYEQRKEQRRQEYLSGLGKKMVVCIACNGSGRYDNTGSPKCWVCGGTGKVKEEEVGFSHFRCNV